jgi:hypothetical protein
MSAVELKFRRFLGPAMADQWMMTWHEDRHISPGVPDLHYVMIDEAAHRVGWLELKAMDIELSKLYRIRVEPSQHQYIRRWVPMMPIHFLIRVKRVIYLVDGKHHDALPEIHNANDMRLICTATCDQADIAKVLTPALKTLTRI